MVDRAASSRYSTGQTYSDLPIFATISQFLLSLLNFCSAYILESCAVFGRIKDDQNHMTCTNQPNKHLCILRWIYVDRRSSDYSTLPLYSSHADEERCGNRASDFNRNALASCLSALLE